MTTTLNSKPPQKAYAVNDQLLFFAPCSCKDSDTVLQPVNSAPLDWFLLMFTG